MAITRQQVSVCGIVLLMERGFNMPWRYRVVGVKPDKREIELLTTFSYGTAMRALAYFNAHLSKVTYKNVYVEFPFWSIH